MTSSGLSGGGLGRGAAWSNAPARGTPLYRHEEGRARMGRAPVAVPSLLCGLGFSHIKIAMRQSLRPLVSLLLVFSAAQDVEARGANG